MKNSKQCPKCLSRDIYTNEGLTKRGERCMIPASSWKSVFIDVYVCMQCGFFEEYLDMKDSSIGKLRENWKKA